MFNVVKDGLSQIGLRNEKKGGVNVFKSIDETQLAGGNLDDVLNSLDLGGIIIGAVDKSMGEYRNTFESVTDLARGDAKLFERAAINLSKFDSNIRKKRVYNSDNKYKMTINRTKWNNFADDIIDDEFQKNEWVTDIAGMSLAFKNDLNFAERVYVGSLENRSIDYTKKDIQDFRKKISSSEQYRLDIATAITAQQGFETGGGFLSRKPEFYAFDTDEKLYEKYQYNRYKGSVPAILGEGIIFNKQTNNYVTDKSWDSMNEESKKQSFDLKFKEVATSSGINGQQKIMMLEKFFNDIPNPYETTYEEYMETRGAELLAPIRPSLFDRLF